MLQIGINVMVISYQGHIKVARPNDVSAVTLEWSNNPIYVTVNTNWISVNTTIILFNVKVRNVLYDIAEFWKNNNIIMTNNVYLNDIVGAIKEIMLRCTILWALKNLCRRTCFIVVLHITTTNRKQTHPDQLINNYKLNG